MKEPVLIIMAAGLGSRYGGLKQMDPIGSDGELILDFSLYDAYMAGFKEAICVIKKENEKDFKDLLEQRAGKFINIRYAFQEMEDLPKGYEVPAGRTKPWGTCHAVLSARDMIEGPFAVINADDYYGAAGFQSMYEFLLNSKDDEKLRYSMVGYQIKNTITENGTVARGVCNVDHKGFLSDINERTKVKRLDSGEIAYESEDESQWVAIPEESSVSMNFWGFNESMIGEMERLFTRFFDEIFLGNPEKSEYFLPLAVDWLLKEGSATVQVIPTSDKWYGVTYKEDRESVVEALQSLKDKGLYPEKLWA